MERTSQMKGYHKTICLNFGSEGYYQDCMNDADKFKNILNELNQRYPELFPIGFEKGWKLNGFTPRSKKVV